MIETGETTEQLKVHAIVDGSGRLASRVTICDSGSLQATSSTSGVWLRQQRSANGIFGVT